MNDMTAPIPIPAPFHQVLCPGLYRVVCDRIIDDWVFHPFATVLIFVFFFRGEAPIQTKRK